MKHIFEILEEEKKRILNLHETSTKSQYLNVINEDAAQLQSRAKACGWTLYSSESGVTSADVEGYKNSGWECPKGSGKRPEKKTEVPPTKQVTTTPQTNTTKQVTTTQPKVSNLDKATVSNIQTLLKSKGLTLGNTGPNKDGVDGVLGNTTLKAIESALKSTQPAAAPQQPAPQQPTQKLPTLPAGTAQRPGQPTQLAGQNK